ncbi:DNA translocase FtsK [Metabacillus sp. GX 13764]|uniref:DNA translocase FtsK n=1 Tax=Metabacillus kandeliae TaxID=2900151 RepID=UPI001E2DEF45|nr:DNA translocase FtsK [Metabacillus kandeliae]MCD7032722.1 DNA translocase FtsK [Metabacillus kandeliae]
MSWFSKFKNFFVTEVDEEKEIDLDPVNVLADKQPSRPRPSENPPSYRGKPSGAEAKISYQYPSANFRFPIIPDGKSKEPHRQKQHVKHPGKKADKPKPKPGPAFKKEAAQARQQPKENYRSVPDKRPFQPTEIPSPIYGFRPRTEMESQPYQVRERSRQSRVEEEEILRKISSHSLRLAKEKALSKKDIGTESQEAKQENVRRMNGSGMHETLDWLQKESTRSKEGREASRNKQEEAALLHEETEELPLMDEAEYKESIAAAENLQLVEASDKDEAGSFQEITMIEEEKEDLAEISLEQDQQEEFSEEELEREAPAEHLFNFAEENNDAPVYEEQKIPEENTGFEESSERTPSPALSLVTEETQAVPEKRDDAPVNEASADRESLPAQTGEPAVQTAGKRPPERPERSRSPQPGIPYNVLMLTRDKPKQADRTHEGSYAFPSIQLLNVPQAEFVLDNEWLMEQKELLHTTLKNFNVGASVVNVTQGPSVTRFEVHPEPGVKVNKITNLSDDIKLSLSARDIRIEAPIPGKNTIGIEVPNQNSKMVTLREIARSPEFRNSPSPLTVSLGLDISGQPVVTDLKKMPHGLIAGATGSGKSVCINTMLVSLLYKASPHEVKLLLIDPKMVELAPYNYIPHLVSPVVTDVKAATGALKWAVEEMERRYELFAHAGVRDISRYNEMVKAHEQGEHMPFLVIVIDELADLMMVAPNDVEEAICRIAQKARACGIHLIVATQRPSVDVITGLIKANIPTRIAFSVSSQIDSRTIIDASGAEKLLGKGDMLFLENGKSKTVRIQGNFVSDDEIERVVGHVKKQMKPEYLFHQEEFMKKSSLQSEGDELFYEACEFVVQHGTASASGLQRRFRVGYNRAARLIDLMEEQGIISEARGSKPRDILISGEDLLELQESNVF